jgi:L-threonylcarbamoyladenylate synthase
MKVSCEKAIEILKKGGLVALPTETVYGLAAPIDKEDSLKNVFSLKERPFFDPLIVHIAELDQLWALVSEQVATSRIWRLLIEQLAQNFWPGPLTLVLPKSDRVLDVITSGLDTVAIRYPNHPSFLQVVKGVGAPLAAPSANLFGRTSPTEAAHVEAEFPELSVVDGGRCSVGLESTVLKICIKEEGLELQILRPGLITLEQIRSVINHVMSQTLSTALPLLRCTDMKIVWNKFARLGGPIEAPGQIRHHYRPKKPLFFVRNEKEIDEALKAHKALESITDKEGWEIKLSHEPAQAARELYSKMRELDLRPEPFGFVFSQSTWFSDPNWAAILDRLSRAASWASKHLD